MELVKYKLCLDSELKTSGHQADLDGWILFYCFELIVCLYGTRVRKKRRGKREVIQHKEVNCINSFTS